jgi:hypothetical protein
MAKAVALGAVVFSTRRALPVVALQKTRSPLVASRDECPRGAMVVEAA